MSYFLWLSIRFSNYIYFLTLCLTYVLFFSCTQQNLYIRVAHLCACPEHFPLSVWKWRDGYSQSNEEKRICVHQQAGWKHRINAFVNMLQIPNTLGLCVLWILILHLITPILILWWWELAMEDMCPTPKNSTSEHDSIKKRVLPI